MLKTLLYLIVTFSLSALSAPKYVKMDHNFLHLDGKKYLVISLENEKDWHTYWKNPGDAGLAPKFNFSLEEKEIKLQELEWPTPKKYIEQGNILAYGYSGKNYFFFEISKNNYELLLDKTLVVKAHWLVCKDICIPGEGSLNIDTSLWPNKKDLPQITKAFTKLPKTIETPSNLQINLVKTNKENTLALHYELSGVSFNSFNKKQNLLTPFQAVPLDFKHEKIAYDKSSQTLYGLMLIGWDGEFEEPVWNLPKDGNFEKELNLKFIFQNMNTNSNDIVKLNTKYLIMSGHEAYENFFNELSSDKTETKESKQSESLLYFIVFAFLGGLILNLMPCVLPVISLKLFGLISHSNESNSKILKHNLFYSFGVWSTFIALGLVILGIKKSGSSIGWGFQLQSPIFLFIMLTVLFIMTLNLFGLFEFVTPGGKSLGNKEIKDSYAGDFFSGVLATILSTPCSAPFLGVALTFAFTTSDINIFIIFSSIALGLCAPFLITGFFPKTVSFLPKPGNWMIKFKYFLGLTMLLTFVWLLDVLFSIIDSSIAGLYIYTYFTLIFFAFFIRAKITKNKIINIIFFILPFALMFYASSVSVFDESEVAEVKSSSDLNWKNWKKRSDSISNGNWAFIDFTAKWCLTCKVNKKIVFDSSTFKELVDKEQIDLYIADWTKRDEDITKFLRSYDVVGVPAYFLQTPGGKVIHLGETISVSKIKKNLN